MGRPVWPGHACPLASGVGAWELLQHGSSRSGGGQGCLMEALLMTMPGCCVNAVHVWLAGFRSSQCAIVQCKE